MEPENNEPLPEEIAPAEPAKKSAPSGADLYGWLQSLMFVLLGLILVFTFVGRIVGVDGKSMLPTLHHRDMLLLQCVGYTPRQNDVVVLNKHFAGVEGPIVKRVIATGGQTVDVDYQKGEVLVDGVALDEPYINEVMVEVPNSQNVITHAEIPEGSIFVMGDNRNHSSDSRHPELGIVDQRYVLGRAFFILFPFSHLGTIG
ncbi:MAG: signal peptidase I [Oscillospiraceae bacterium]